MSHTRRSPGGFSLTEVLMAVGILGIGLSMVATIFPVAVDQTRRATDSTMSALCARSIAAMIRANRGKFVDAHRNYFKQLLAGTTNDRERPAEFAVVQPASDVGTTRWNPGIVWGLNTTEYIIAKDMRVYNPNMFLYEAGRRYLTESPVNDPFWPQWNAGNYVPVIYVTPIVPVANRSYNGSAASGNDIYNNAGGPWRVTIVVFKSRGTEKMHLRTRSWFENAKPSNELLYISPMTWAAGPGDYVIDRSRHAGEAYMIEQVLNDPAKTVSAIPGNAARPPIFLACGVPASFSTAATLTTKTGWGAVALGDLSTAQGTQQQIWYPLPGAVAVYHTIIGD